MKSTNYLKSLKDKSVEELQVELVDCKKELFNLRFRNATNQLQNTASINEARKNIARIQTEMTIRAMDIAKNKTAEELSAELKRAKDELAALCAKDPEIIRTKRGFSTPQGEKIQLVTKAQIKRFKNKANSKKFLEDQDPNRERKTELRKEILRIEAEQKMQLKGHGKSGLSRAKRKAAAAKQLKQQAYQTKLANKRAERERKAAASNK